MLGGDVTERWADKHVTQNGNNQAPITDPTSDLGETHAKTHVHSRLPLMSRGHTQNSEVGLISSFS